MDTLDGRHAGRKHLTTNGKCSNASVAALLLVPHAGLVLLLVLGLNCVFMPTTLIVWIGNGLWQRGNTCKISLTWEEQQVKPSQLPFS